MKKYVLSIIIPVYNVEKYLEKCLYSVTHQEGVASNDYEIILINDGSLDNSLAIAEKFSKDCTNMIIKSQPNCGLSAARNMGISLANGEYVWCIDSDDWIESYAVHFILNEIQKKKVDFISISAYRTDTKVKRNIALKTESPIELLCSSTWSPNAQYYIYRSEFLHENDLNFKVGIYHEDSEFTPRMMFCARSCNVTNEMLYYSFCNPTSITQTANPKKGYDNLIAALSLSDFSQKRIKEQKVMTAFSNFISMLINNGLSDILKHKEHTFEFNGFIYKNKEIVIKELLSSSFLKYKIEGLLFRIFVNRYVEIYSKLIKLKRSNL